ncbi:MAG: FG-GAP-like repeat-containing protein [Acidobacteriota bacterium]|nr:FG-GAP-like repeat-containing protein [Acidobacteriota bacterium]
MPVMFTPNRKRFYLSLLAFTVLIFAVVFGSGKTAARSENAAPQATFTVNRTDDAPDANTADNVCDVDLSTAGQQCTLRAAIAQANATAEADLIGFSLPMNETTINLTGASLIINRNVEIRGPGARNLIVSGANSTARPIFDVVGGVSNPPITVSISGLTVANGVGSLNFASGIRSSGAVTLNLTEVTLRNNRGSIGGAILHEGNVLNILRSTITDNTATRTGGAIHNTGGTVNIANSTIANNTANDTGGGIFNEGDLTLNNVSIANNTAANGGGGVTNLKTAMVRNTIIAGNRTLFPNGSPPVINPDILEVSAFTSLGNNLVGIADFSTGFLNGIGGDIVGSTAAPVNPLLEPLRNNGGPTDTMALIPASPAVDAGNLCVVNAICPVSNPPVPLLTDQRGGSFPRMVGYTVDMGAYELNVPEPVITSISPTRIAAGSGEFEIVVTGNGFVNGSIVQWNGQNRPTTFVSPTELRARISAADVQQADEALVRVFNPIPGGGVSNNIVFVVFNCSYTLNPTSQNVPASNVGVTFSVTAPAGCGWTATTTVPWISITNGSGTGNGTVAFTVQANMGPARSGTITVGGQTFTVNQASGCVFTLNPTTANLPAAGGNTSFTVSASDAGCTWTAVSNAPWITVNPVSGTGNGAVNLTVAANSGPARSGTITIGGQAFTINQASGCTYMVSATDLNVNSAGGNGSVSVTASAPGCTWTAASNSTWITITSGVSGSGNGTVNFTAAPNTGAVRIGTITVAGQTVTINQPAPTNFNKTRFDFDGDGRADLSVFRPSTGAWHISQSSNGVLRTNNFGQAGDLLAPADFDGDGRTDIAVFRFGFWYRINSLTNQFVATQFGSPGDIPVPADYDGDGLAEVSVFRPSNGVWYRINTSNNQFVAVPWGMSGDIPLIGDYDGDGKTDLTVFRPSTSSFFVLRSSDNSSFGARFGIAGDIPVEADFDGDKKTDIALYRPSNGTWYRINSSNNEFVAQRFGLAEDKPVAADYDGDGRADIAVYRPSESLWYLLRSTGGFQAQPWGTLGDIPVPALNR